jgi:hypothetical protein
MNSFFLDLINETRKKNKIEIEPCGKVIFVRNLGISFVPQLNCMIAFVDPFSLCFVFDTCLFVNIRTQESTMFYEKSDMNKNLEKIEFHGKNLLLRIDKVNLDSFLPLFRK